MRGCECLNLSITKVYLACLGIIVIPQFSHLKCPLDLDSALIYRQVLPSSQWLCEYKNTARTFPHIFTSSSFRLKRLCWNGLAFLIGQLIQFFIHANFHIAFIKRQVIHFQNVLLTCHESSVVFRLDMPTFIEMRLQFVFSSHESMNHEKCFRCP